MRSREQFLRSEGALGALLVLVVATPLLLLAGNAYRSWVQAFDQTSRRLEQGVDLLHEHAAKAMETTELVAGFVDEMLAEMPPETVIARESEVHARLNALTKRLPQIADIWVIDATGRPLAAAAYPAIDHGMSLADRKYFQTFASGERPLDAVYVSEILTGRFDPTVRFFQVSAPRRDRVGGAFAGVVAVSADPSYFETFYRQIAGGFFDTLSLVREDGRLLVRHPRLPPGLDAIPRQHAFHEAVTTSPGRGFYEAVSHIDGEDRIVAYRRLAEFPLYVTSGVARASIVDQWRDEQARILAIGLPLLAGLAGLAVFALNRVRREAAAHRALLVEIERREAAEAQARHAQKLEAVGRLTGGVAHDFNNLLQAAGASLDVLGLRLPDLRAEDRSLLERARESLDRGAKLTRRLLAFARRQPLDPQPVEVGELVDETLRLMATTLGHAVRTTARVEPGLGAVFVDRDELETALINLLINARDAMPDGGAITVAAEAAASPDGAPMVAIAVADEGRGIPPEDLDKIFEPFFTTKPPGAGTGLGLSQVYGFVGQSGGDISVESAPGRGTSVRMLLPRWRGDAAGPARRTIREDAAPQVGARRRPSATVLLVEDDAAVRAATREMLAQLGCSVIEADRAEAALAALERTSVDLLLTDVAMPGGDGVTLAAEAQRRQPGLPILLMTGDVGAHAGAVAAAAPARTLWKPFDRDALGRALESVLPGGAGAARSDTVGPSGPGHAAGGADASAAPDPGPALRIRAKVLCVEDEPFVALGLEDMVREVGFEPVVATRAETALAAHDDHGDFIAVLTDAGLPGASGADLIRRLRERGSSALMVLCTGDAASGDGLKPPARVVLKPYTIADIRRVLKEAVDCAGRDPDSGSLHRAEDAK